MQKSIFALTLSSLALTACQSTTTPNPTPTPIASPLSQVDTDLPTEPGSMAMLAGSNAIYVNNQMPGNTINVTTILLQNPGFVVIHEVDANGQPGEVLGASNLLETDAVSATVTLDDEVEDGTELIAMLHADTDGNGEFTSETVDKPILDETTNDPIQMQFLISEDADEQPVVMP